jgi:hypothetical protein
LHTAEQIVGVVLLALALVDVFLTILYARLESGFLGMRVVRGIAQVFVRSSKLVPKRRARFVSLCGPVALVSLALFWAGLLVVGGALLVQPALGTGIRPPSGASNGTDFITALYVAGSSMSIVASSGWTPETPLCRLVFVLMAAVGVGFTTLMVTYLLQLYSALLQRNALGRKIDALTEDKGDAAELLCRIGPRGRFDVGGSLLGELAGEMSAVAEAHHIYPMLIFFRFEEPRYAVSRMAQVTLDAVSLVMSSLDDELAWFAESGGPTHLWRSSISMLDMLAREVDDECPRREPTRRELALWRKRHAGAMHRLRAAGIPTRSDEDAAFTRYAELRQRWDALVQTLAPELAYDIEEIDRPTQANTAASKLAKSKNPRSIVHAVSARTTARHPASKRFSTKARFRAT